MLIKRRAGGVGDVLMQRMMMEDTSQVFDGVELHYCCPDNFLYFASQNPFVKTIRLGSMPDRHFGAVYDITTACRVHESMMGARNRDHRSDIWSRHCGITLQNHRMHLKADNPDLLQKYREALKSRNPQGKPTVLLCPHSENNSFGIPKSMTDLQIAGIVRYLNMTDHKVFTIHNRSLEVLTMLGVDQYVEIHPETWMYLTKLADYVITVDTGSFHLAGGLGKPMVGIFTFTDGKVYGKYYDFVLVQKHRDDGWDCGPCFAVTECRKSKEDRKPCCTEIRVEDIISAFETAKRRWPPRFQEF